MSESPKTNRDRFLTEFLNQSPNAAVSVLIEAVTEKHPGAAVLLYGSGNSVLSESAPTDVLFDFYVIAPSYSQAYDKSGWLTFLNWLIPPNVFYLECPSDFGKLRAKYAVLSIDHFEKLTGPKTFHSYFWARFAQPCRIVHSPNELTSRLQDCLAQAIDTFVARAAPLVEDADEIDDIWRCGLSRSYKAELRAEPPDRVDRLLQSYGDWPHRVTDISVAHRNAKTKPTSLGWRLRSVQGGFLSVIRLLKGTLTFQGGVDYIVWKISRHAGFTVPVKDWERKFPLIGAFTLARRYYKMKNAAK